MNKYIFWPMVVNFVIFFGAAGASIGVSMNRGGLKEKWLNRTAGIFFFSGLTILAQVMIDIFLYLYKFTEQCFSS